MIELDVWRTATLLIRLHGDSATLNVAQRADALLAKGDSKGGAVRVAVVHAIEELERMTPREGEATHGMPPSTATTSFPGLTLSKAGSSRSGLST